MKKRQLASELVAGNTYFATAISTTQLTYVGAVGNRHAFVTEESQSNGFELFPSVFKFFEEVEVPTAQEAAEKESELPTQELAEALALLFAHDCISASRALKIGMRIAPEMRDGAKAFAGVINANYPGKVADLGVAALKNLMKALHENRE